MTVDELIAALEAIQRQEYDPERQHEEADGLLLRFINDPRVTEAFRLIAKWYS